MHFSMINSKAERQAEDSEEHCFIRFSVRDMERIDTQRRQP
jgi:hypothetical protein